MLYIRAVLSFLPQYGLTAFVALHQDVWSRYAGVSSAPAWTLEQKGFVLSALLSSRSSDLCLHVGLGKTAQLGGATIPSKFLHLLSRAHLYAAQFDPTLSTARSTLTTITRSPCCHTPSGISRVWSTVRCLPTFPSLVSSLTTRGSCRRPQELRWCPGGYNGRDELLVSTSGAGAPTLAHAARQSRQEARRRPSAS